MVKDYTSIWTVDCRMWENGLFYEQKMGLKEMRKPPTEVGGCACRGAAHPSTVALPFTHNT